jgi:hypothetical protein
LSIRSPLLNLKFQPSEFWQVGYPNVAPRNPKGRWKNEDVHANGRHGAYVGYNSTCFIGINGDVIPKPIVMKSACPEKTSTTYI